MNIVILLLLACLPFAFGCSSSPPNDCSYCQRCVQVEREQVFGGTQADKHEWPWMVSFGTWDGSHWSHYCGGSIIANRTIISASHCFFKKPNRYSLGGYKIATKIRIGDQNLNDASDDGQFAKTYTVNTIIRHEKYVGRGIFYDVALIHTEEDIEFNRHTAPICMTTVANSDVQPTDEVHMAGWGYVDDDINTKPSDTLQETSLQVLQRSECRQRTGFDDDLIFCVGNPNGGSVSCRGDSGAPLVKELTIENGVTFKYLIGILHGSRAKCNSVTSDYPGVYANLANEEIFTFVQKWKSIDSLFTSEISNNEWRDLFKTMTNLDPVNDNGLRLSEYISSTAPRLVQLITDTNCDLDGTSTKLYDGRCVCKTGYAGRICNTCDHITAWNNSTTVSNCNEGHFVLITSGYPFSNGQKTRVLNFKNDRFICPGLPDYPIKMTYGVGGMIGNVPLICGGNKGYSGSRTFHGDCFMLKGKQWIKNGSLDQPRSSIGTGTIVMNNELFTNGGILDEDKSYSKSNERIGLTFKSKLPDLPKSRFDHCNIPINDTHYIITGGKEGLGSFWENGDDTTKTLIFDKNTNTFSEGPSLNQARQAHGCFSAKIGFRQVLFVTGGKYGYILDTTEFLDLSQPELKWTYGQNLPFKVRLHRMVQTPDAKSVYLTGGLDSSKEVSNKILEMKCPDQTPASCYFDEIPTKLKYPRQGHIALAITEEFAKELCQ